MPRMIVRVKATLATLRSQTWRDDAGSPPDVHDEELSRGLAERRAPPALGGDHVREPDHHGGEGRDARVATAPDVVGRDVHVEADVDPVAEQGLDDREGDQQHQRVDEHREHPLPPGRGVRTDRCGRLYGWRRQVGGHGRACRLRWPGRRAWCQSVRRRSLWPCCPLSRTNRLQTPSGGTASTTVSRDCEFSCCTRSVTVSATTDVVPTTVVSSTAQSRLISPDVAAGTSPRRPRWRLVRRWTSVRTRRRRPAWMSAASAATATADSTRRRGPTRAACHRPNL
jgi:hypothetical protein